MSRELRARRTLGVGARVLGPDPVVVGILNVTPDSFSDAGEFFDPEAAVAHAARMLGEGAGIIDVGGESTRPGSEPVEPAEEVRRVVPVIREIKAECPGAVISIDTRHSSTAEAALEAGAEVVNDITGMLGDERMASLVADSGVPVVLMHMQGEPKTMQLDPHYDDVTAEVREFLSRRVAAAVAAGIDPEKIILDPGIGFGKKLEHNLTLLDHLGAIANLGQPLLVGTSRKSFLGRIPGSSDSSRAAGTIATSVMAYERGATLFRVHDVQENRQALQVAAAIRRRGAGA